MNLELTKFGDLIDLTHECLGVVAETTLDWEWFTLDNEPGESADYLISIPIESSSLSMDLTLAFDVEDARQITHKMMMFEEDEELPEDIDLTDAIGEVANIAAGEIKKALSTDDGNVRIGLPRLTDGEALETKKEKSDQVSMSAVQLGPTLARVELMIRHNEQSIPKEI